MAKESERRNLAVFFGAGPDIDHPASAGYVLPLFGHHTEGDVESDWIRFQNGRTYTNLDFIPLVQWFGFWRFLGYKTKAEFYAETT